MKKTAVVLLNLGGPDKPESVQPFLFNLFNDKAIIGAPQPIRWLIAKLISTRRAPVAQEIYEHLGGKSPLLELTQEQATALEEKLNSTSQPSPATHHYKTFICMRYWHPMSAETIQQVKDWGADEVILLPLYPQFSTTTVGSSFNDWQNQSKKLGLDVPTARIGCYPLHEDFIISHVNKLKPQYDKMEKKYTDSITPRILFSAHGLPQKVVDAGDPYQWQVEQCVEAIVKEMGVNNLDYVTCYQSKVGPLQWLEPSTEKEIERAAKEGVPIIIVPIAFVSEHSETLVELDIEYREMAEELGIKEYDRVPALGVEEHYVNALANLCQKAKMNSTRNDRGIRHCPAQFSKCVCESKAA